MAKWEETIGNDKYIYKSCVASSGLTDTVIGNFTHVRIDNGKITGYKTADGLEMKIKRDDITVTDTNTGIKYNWFPVTYMDTNVNRETCAMWVYELFKEGKLRKLEAAR